MCRAQGPQSVVMKAYRQATRMPRADNRCADTPAAHTAAAPFVFGDLEHFSGAVLGFAFRRS
jgi:hypothetical protein